MAEQLSLTFDVHDTSSERREPREAERCVRYSTGVKVPLLVRRVKSAVRVGDGISSTWTAAFWERSCAEGSNYSAPGSNYSGPPVMH